MFLKSVMVMMYFACYFLIDFIFLEQVKFHYKN